ncbi:putative polysaccharide biosynthesis protein [Magnetofaba australis IT-1]|uniref:Putative polysaccharide biosynthesis protein n=1 Tax=Magnetofaba australis IT-1 TaxID=1434232 RepID=A0A1Y2K0H1_9PROT|nr:putative polysaccharide biosynthesis protein [Magnetofaba australis IT-1]
MFHLSDADAAPLARKRGFDVEPWPDPLADLPGAHLLLSDSVLVDWDASRAWDAARHPRRAAIVDDGDTPVDAHFLINPNISGEEVDYADSLYCELLAGPDYALLDPRLPRYGKILNRKNVLVNLRGCAPDHQAGELVDALLQQLPDVHVDLLTEALFTRAGWAPHVAERGSDRRHAHYGAHPPDLMHRACCYIGAADDAAVAAAAAGMSLLLYDPAPKRALAVRAFGQFGARILSRWDPDAIAEMMAQERRMGPPSRLAQRLDGRGAERLARRLLSDL